MPLMLDRAGVAVTNSNCFKGRSKESGFAGKRMKWRTGLRRYCRGAALNAFDMRIGNSDLLVIGLF